MKKRINLPSEQDRHVAKLIAMVVRNAMEDFHVKHLSDTQMKELNPIIRDAVLTALHMIRNSFKSDRIKSVLGWTGASIPDYWEEPKLRSDYVDAITMERLYGNEPISLKK